MLVKSIVEQPSTSVLSRKWTILLCIGCFCAGIIFTSRTLDETILNLEIELAAARAAQESVLSGSPQSEDLKNTNSSGKRRYFMVVGINTAFSSLRRRDSVRATWMPQGERRKKLEEEKGVVICFVIGHSTTAGGILDGAIEAEHKKLNLQPPTTPCGLESTEGYLELSAETKTYFATALSVWNADFYVKVDDDVRVNIATLGETLGRYWKKPRVYIGCMKSGPVLAQKGVRYHEPEHWKFGEMGNKYFCHATHVLHKYANEDVSLGAWFIGLDVQHIDERRLCCGTRTPPDCEWNAHVGNICVASFDWSCRGICWSVERIKEVHRWSGESENAVYCCFLRITPVVLPNSG
ncbi:putative beta-1,3-galactosyltransferase 2 [Camellia lanceoleosa]|uniref:Beta-1,3-galactosyltransferase 2 n=1 Tax=Camellia lanceoleosa TaxID=1840588 RepID=A0ACC0H7P1_9ERIC|nr:putative beta-1,3-galactosyltransferase 2 [Camellia lanceoleosa]